MTNKSLSNSPKEPNLKGTLVSVSILGALIVVSWFGALAIFLSR